MDRTTARGFVANKVEDPDQTKFSSSQYNAALELAQQQFAIDARAIVKETTLTEADGTQEINLPTDFLVCALVRHKGIKLAPTTKYELSFQNGSNWQSAPAGTPVGYYIDDEDETIGLFPKPDAAAAGANLLLNYVSVPAAMTADTDILLSARTILQYYASGVVAWAAYEMLSYVPQTPEVIAKRAGFLKDYERYKNEAITTYNNMADQPIRMQGGQVWQDSQTRPKDNAFTG